MSETPSAVPPFPPSNEFLKAIRESSKALRTRANIKITRESIRRLLTSTAFTSSFQRVSALHGLSLPLKFDSNLDELNLISILSIFNFASGYRVPLHEQLRRGAWDTMRAFVFSLFITSTSEQNYLTSRGMKDITVAKVAELMGVNIHIESSHAELPGVVVGRLGGPLYQLVTLITHVLNETGAILINGGYPNLGSFVLEALKEGGRFQTTSADRCLEVVLERLVKAFPAFQDMAIVDGQPIYCFKKALFLIHAIRVRFSAMSQPPFPMPFTENSPVFTDNVLPSMLVHLGVIDLSESPDLSSLFPDVDSEVNLQRLLGPAPSFDSAPIGVKPAQRPPNEGPTLSAGQAFKLRAAAIEACEMIIEEARSLDDSQGSPSWIKAMTLPELDLWIWSIAKDRPDYRALERFVLRDTVFF